MRFTYCILFFILIFSTSSLKAEQTLYFIDSTGTVVDSTTYSETLLDANAITTGFENNHKPNPILHLLKKRQKKNKRVVAAILAFPFPFGIVGLHRIYLGTAPYVPVVYIGTFGGVIGILPFIDFCVLLLDKDFDRYLDNKKVFMWVK